MTKWTQITELALCLLIAKSRFLFLTMDLLAKMSEEINHVNTDWVGCRGKVRVGLGVRLGLGPKVRLELGLEFYPLETQLPLLVL